MTTFELKQPPSFTKISSHISEGGNEADSCESNDNSSEEDSCHKRQTIISNHHAHTYWLILISYPFLDHMIMELDS
jgi:hypothetical protein